jgi:cytochrome c oxidase subunit III
MGSFTPTIPVKQPLGGQGGGTPPPTGGGGDSGGGGGSLPNYGARLRRARLGLGLCIAAVIMVFVSLTSALIVRKGLASWDPQANANVRDWQLVDLPTQMLLINTVLLLLSSFTIEMARRQAARSSFLAPAAAIPGVSLGDEKTQPWLAITIVLGLGFLTGQYLAWRELAHRGYYLARPISSSFVYLLTITHAVHLAGGMIGLFYAGASSLLRKPVEIRRIRIDITAWYWHFMGLLWLYIFALLQFAR